MVSSPTGTGLMSARSSRSHRLELLNFLCGCDTSRWPFPWWHAALSALPREIPQQQGGLNPYLFKAPYWRKETPSTAASEQWHQVPVPKGSRNKPLSPPRPKVVQTQLGWADPIALYSKIAKDELTFLLQPFNSLPEYGEARIRWHQKQCPLTNITDFLLYIEQHTFFLLFIKLAGSLALSEPEQFTGEQRESVLGQLAVCPSQLRNAFEQDSGDLKISLQYMDYAEWVHGYMLEVLDLPVPIMGKNNSQATCLKGSLSSAQPSCIFIMPCRFNNCFCIIACNNFSEHHRDFLQEEVICKGPGGLREVGLNPIFPPDQSWSFLFFFVFLVYKSFFNHCLFPPDCHHPHCCIHLCH